MMRSLYAGVSGLKTHQARMDVIGNNIANVNTTAYKKSSMTFSELMYQTSQRASGPNATTGKAGVNARQIGLGVTTGAITTAIAEPGSAQTTGNAWDLKMTGGAFFIVNDGRSNYFTRDGSFYVDTAGNLATAAGGFNVMGWKADANGEIQKDTVSRINVYGNGNQTSKAQATSKATISGVVDKNDVNIAGEAGKTISISIYDNQGYSYQAKFAMKRIGDGSAGQYSYELKDIIDSEGKSIMSKLPPGFTFGTRQVTTDGKTLALQNPYTQLADIMYTPANGNQTAINGGTAYTKANDPEAIAALAKAYGYEGKEDDFLNLMVDDPANPGTSISMETALGAGQLGALLAAAGANNTSIVSVGRQFNGATVFYDTNDGTFLGLNGATGPKSISLNLEGTQDIGFSNVDIDFTASSTGNSGGTATVTGERGGTDNTGAGWGQGKMSSMYVDQQGKIILKYDNDTTKVIAQIAVANFTNPSGLEKQGNNLYSATLNSGDFNGIGQDVSDDGGAMNSGQLEMSNVDLSSEFTEMITTQRGFQANSRIITVSDTLLEELVNLKR